MIQKIQVTIFLLLLFPDVSSAANMHPEIYYQEKWCQENNGKPEVVLPDRTRCDCLTNDYAVEVEFGRKWAESIGQSLYYAIQTNKKAGIVLILERPEDYKYWIRLNTVIDTNRLPVTVWTVDG